MSPSDYFKEGKRIRQSPARGSAQTHPGIGRASGNQVLTNSNLIAPKNYESVGFVLYDTKPNRTESAYTGDYLYYEIIL